MTFKFIAHRGASSETEDNSKDAFELAIKYQSDLIETDVQITQDGVLILEHDFDVESQSVVASRFSELKAMKSHLLTVAEALRDFGNRIPFCWEVKAQGTETALVQLVHDLIPQKQWQQTEFTSFFFGTAVMLRKLAPDNNVGWLTREWSEEAIQKVKAVGLNQICPMAQSVIGNPSLVDTAHDNGLMVRVWSVTSPEMIPDLVKAGVYGGTVNWPKEAREMISSPNQ